MELESSSCHSPAPAGLVEDPDARLHGHLALGTHLPFSLPEMLASRARRLSRRGLLSRGREDPWWVGKEV